MNAWLQRRRVHRLLGQWREQGVVRSPILVCYDALVHPIGRSRPSDHQEPWAQLVFDIIDDYPARTPFRQFGRMLEGKTRALASESDLVIVTNEWLRAKIAGTANAARSSSDPSHGEGEEAADIMVEGGVPSAREARELRGRGGGVDPFGDRLKVLPHGVDSAIFHPDAWRDGPFEAWKGAPGPKVVFHGTLDHKIDLGLLQALLRSGCTVLLAGEMSWPEATLAQLRMLGGLHYFGSLSLAGAAALVSAGDVGILPYLPFPGHQGATILKHLEFLAAGLPVVGTDLPACRRCAEGITVARDAESFVAAVKAAWRESGGTAFAIARNHRIAIARENSWEARAAELDRWLAP